MSILGVQLCSKKERKTLIMAAYIHLKVQDLMFVIQVIQQSDFFLFCYEGFSKQIVPNSVKFMWVLNQVIEYTETTQYFLCNHTDFIITLNQIYSTGSIDTTNNLSKSFWDHTYSSRSIGRFGQNCTAAECKSAGDVLVTHEDSPTIS